MRLLYLDHNATTPLDPLAKDAMLDWLGGKVGNASSVHSFGQQAARALDTARAQAGLLIGAQPEEIVFTSGGTEANNLAILGAVAASGRARPRILTTAIEHQAVLNPCRHVQESGGSVTLVPVDCQGLLDPEGALWALRDETLLASVMLANNDVGTVQPIRALSGRLKAKGVLFHTDAVQAAGKIPVDVKELGVDLLSFSAHKLGGPQGIGALYIKKGTRLAPIQFGGHQERKLRPGTQNVAAAVGFGKACELARDRLGPDSARIEALRSEFENAVSTRIPGAWVNGQGTARLPNTTNITFEGLDGEGLVLNLDLMGLAASTGAACGSTEREPSHVLIAMGLSPDQARGSIRFSFGPENSEDDVARAVEIVEQATLHMRKNRHWS